MRLTHPLLSAPIHCSGRRPGIFFAGEDGRVLCHGPLQKMAGAIAGAAPPSLPGESHCLLDDMLCELRLDFPPDFR